MIEYMFEIIKKNIYYISIPIILLLLVSCIKNGFQIDYLYDFIITLVASIVLFFLDSKLFHKNKINFKSFSGLIFLFCLGFYFLIKSLVKIDSTSIAIMTNLFFIFEFILYKLFDVKYS